MTRLAYLTVLAFEVICLTACGGGSSPAPDPTYPDAVTEITEDDLLAAGLPALPANDGVSAAHTASGDFNSDGVVDAADYVTLHNLTPTADGFTTSVPRETTSRIIAWVMYKLPSGAGGRTRSLIATDLIIDPMIRVFAAVSNFSAGRWEPAGQIKDGTSNTILLSAGPRYNRQNGDCFLLLAVAHPGHGNMNGYQIKLEDVLVSSFSQPAMQSAFEQQEPGGVSWTAGAVRYMSTLSEPGGGRATKVVEQSFLNPGQITPDNPRLLFPQPLNLGSSDGSDWFEFQSLTGDWNSDGLDTIGFYDPAEVNGPRHPYRLSVWDDTDIAHVLSIVPVSRQGGDSVLIGLLLPAVQAQVSISVDPVTDTPERIATVNVRGEFRLEDIDSLAPGIYYMSLNFEEIKVTYTAELMEEEGIFYFILSPPSQS